MPYPVPAKKETSVTMPYKKITIGNIEGVQRYGSIIHILHLPGGQRIITCSWNGSFRVCNLETGAQVGEEWEDETIAVNAMALSPDSKILARGSEDGAVRLWNIDTSKVIKKWTGHTKTVVSLCWSSDGGRMVSGSWDGTFRVWDAESGRTLILGPIKAEETIYVVRFSPDAKMIATGGTGLKIWDANTSKLLTTIKGFVNCLVWTSDGKTLIAGRGGSHHEIQHNHVV